MSLKSKVVDGIEMAGDVYEALVKVRNFLERIGVQQSIPYVAEITSAGKIAIKVVKKVRAVIADQAPVEDLAVAAIPEAGKNDAFPVEVVEAPAAEPVPDAAPVEVVEEPAAESPAKAAKKKGK